MNIRTAKAARAAIDALRSYEVEQAIYGDDLAKMTADELEAAMQAEAETPLRSSQNVPAGHCLCGGVATVKLQPVAEG